ncbi:MAG: peptidoglycan-binding domain-containing protein [Microbacterium sp.]
MSEMIATPVSRGRRWPWLLLSAVVLLALGSGAGWAAFSILKPPADVLEATSHTFVSVESGEVGASIQLNAVAEWTSVPAGANRAAGVVTGVAIAPGDEVSSGSVLYTVDLRPVVVAQGEVPAFRSIGHRVEGPDVAQLQGMLSKLGLYAGPSDGKAGADTVAAIKAWQKASNVPPTGVVEAKDVIYLPALPARVSVDSDVVFRGASLSGGEQVVQALPSRPAFVIPVTEAQAAFMPAGTRVVMTSPEGNEWVAYVLDRVKEPETDVIEVTLEGEDGAVICGDQCGELPATGETMLRTRVITVETVTGLVVPSAALVTDAGGQIALIDEGGERIPVKVIAAAQGMSVVEGIDAGSRVRVPGEGA